MTSDPGSGEKKDPVSYREQSEDLLLTIGYDSFVVTPHPPPPCFNTNIVSFCK